MKAQEQALLQTLQTRFEKNMQRHAGVAWATVHARLTSNPGAMTSLAAMESTGGEPDIIAHDGASGRLVFCDCSIESPAGRRSVCYDGAALAARKENKPRASAAEMAAEMGAQLLTEQQYRALQALGPVDTRTSSWIQTPPAIRKLGGALFCDRRYDQVFVYHNGAESYYAARGFRCALTV